MKVLHIITRLDKGGSAENVLITCKGLNKKDDFEVVLVYGGETRVDLGFKSYYIKELQREISPIKDMIALFKILSVIKKERPDIVHTHSSKAGVLGRWATFFYNCKRIINYEFKKSKIVHTPHGHVFYGYYNFFKTMIFILVEQITAKITDKLIALTEGERDESLRFGVGRREQWVIIHSGIDYKSRITNCKLKQEFNINNGELVIGTVARLEPIKGIKYLIEAAKVVKESSSESKNYKFLIVGDGRERKKLEYLVSKLRLNDMVIFTGMREDVVELMSIMDIYVQPSINEGMGKTIIMAQMIGKPIVATTVQGIPSVVINNETGILVLPKNAELLAEAIMKLSSNKELRERFGKNAYLWTNKIVDGFPQFSKERMVLLLEGLYKNLVL